MRATITARPTKALRPRESRWMKDGKNAYVPPSEYGVHERHGEYYLQGCSENCELMLALPAANRAKLTEEQDIATVCDVL